MSRPNFEILRGQKNEKMARGNMTMFLDCRIQSHEMIKIPKSPIIFQMFKADEKDWLSHAFVFGFARAGSIQAKQTVRAIVVFCF